MKVEASAPSNIALIKYMGKVASESNLPSNASLSYTLEHLRSFVTIEESLGLSGDEWQPLEGMPRLELSENGKRKFIAHFGRLKELWSIPGFYVVRSANNFPSDCGLASSASSFAALTMAAGELARARGIAGGDYSAEALSRFSRRGSGSSCRSFFSPWAMWRGEGAEIAKLDVKLEHAVVVVEAGRKSVSSSEAHKRVTTSLLYQRRTERAEQRLDDLMKALKRGEWRASFEICWNEFWDMHALFETSRPAFGYMTAGSHEVLNVLRNIWSETGDGPLVTMDAGANIHVLLRAEQTRAAESWLAPWKTIRSWA